jgi:pyrimidine deaminase RibD-like protein
MQEAFLISKGTLYFSSVPFSFSPIRSAVTELIQGIWESFPEDARSLVRERIHTNYALTPICMGITKVAAKRISVIPKDAFQRLKESHVGDQIQMKRGNLRTFNLGEEIKHPIHVHPEQAQDYLSTLILKASGTTPVGAMLVDQDHRLIAHAWSQSEYNKTAHAELNLVQDLHERLGRTIKPGSTLYISLRPCAMCSAQILALSEEIAQVKIRFLNEDPGPASKNSALYRGSELWIRAGSPNIDITSMNE